MTIESTSQIDILTVRESLGQIQLTISDHLPWEQSDKLLLIQQKVNHYLAFIESGEMESQHPKSATLTPVLKLISLYPPQSTDLEFLKQVQAIIEDAGYGFGWQCFNPEKNQIINTEEL